MKKEGSVFVLVTNNQQTKRKQEEKDNMKKNTKLGITCLLTLIFAMIGAEIGSKIGDTICGWQGSFFGSFIGALIFCVVGSLIIYALFWNQMFEGTRCCYRIVNNKLYYNINCNGKIEPHFITDVDMYSDKFMIVNSHKNYFPIVMVNGELKFFYLKDIVYIESDCNFYTVQDIEIEEVLMENKKALLKNCYFVYELDNKYRIKAQYLKIEIKIPANSAIFYIKQRVSKGTKKNSKYEPKKKHNSWRKAYQHAKTFIEC